MANTDVIVLGAGIVGTSIAFHLVKRGLAVALIDRRGPGEETSYGNAGVIEGNTLLPHPFPSGLSALLRVATKRATEASYHLSFLPQVAPWLLAYRANSALDRRMSATKRYSHAGNTQDISPSVMPSDSWLGYVACAATARRWHCRQTG